MQSGKLLGVRERFECPLHPKEGQQALALHTAGLRNVLPHPKLFNTTNNVLYFPVSMGSALGV